MAKHDLENWRSYVQLLGFESSLARDDSPSMVPYLLTDVLFRPSYMLSHFLVSTFFKFK